MGRWRSWAGGEQRQVRRKARIAGHDGEVGRNSAVRAAAGRRSAVRSYLRSLTLDRPSTAALLLGREQGLQIVRKVTGWWGLAIGLMATALSVVLLVEDVEGAFVAGSFIVGIGAIGLSSLFLLIGERSSEGALTALSLGALVAMVIEAGLVGPRFEMTMVVAGLAGMQSLFYLRRRMAVAGNLLIVGSYAVLVLGFDGYPAPWARLLVFVTVLIATSSVLAWIVGQIEALSDRERAGQAELAATSAALAEANQLLEERVGRQGEEIGALQRLRRFVSPQVAEALLQGGMEALAPHRSRIAVLFCDLRGFTSFSSHAEPEEVDEVLSEFYATVGRALDDAGATVGSFAGDGIMAYFGDPIPTDDPAATAVRTAVSMRDDMVQVVLAWRRRGHDVGCGMGIAYGYATVGPVGFDGRTDYTALGPTVNLASRLCDLAADGDLLIDGRAHVAVEGRVLTDERLVEVRGLSKPVVVHQVRAWHDDPQAFPAQPPSRTVG
jgi:class 3 adenylate cyclase